MAEFLRFDVETLERCMMCTGWDRWQDRTPIRLEREPIEASVKRRFEFEIKLFHVKMRAEYRIV